ncbi:hypothetical protein ASswx1_390 [Aeromonas phage Asswx_1]|uniref:Uncharacterized protein n=1 Tax=Aeromonas phage Asswx_1 TaxID=2419739 RepID=A0A411B8W5_9CAUD|nr:hypothetical protein ASswx1_390 [Aeromonas phage Asswx_1]
MKHHATLSKVRPVPGNRLSGLIYDDCLTRFENGDSIVTSPITEKIEFDGEVRYVKTETGTVYLIGSWVHALDL